jgi:deoxyribodipyrimidine photo-lyase
MRACEEFLREIGWREFAHHVLFHFPHTAEKPLRGDFASFPRAGKPGDLRAWKRGRTGFPLVDAGMRELRATGWMHPRVRMVAASFLVKDLRIHWLEGARWFWDTLVDADLANNTMGWQRSAGCGADSAPFFRIFNPSTPGSKVDPEGAYVRRWIPELTRLPKAWIHRPFEAPIEVLAAAGVDLGKTYPRPIVDHMQARARVLAALSELSTDEGD